MPPRLIDITETECRKRQGKRARRLNGVEGSRPETPTGEVKEMSNHNGLRIIVHSCCRLRKGLLCA
jgi:hypothetical protein